MKDATFGTTCTKNGRKDYVTKTEDAVLNHCTQRTKTVFLNSLTTVKNTNCNKGGTQVMMHNAVGSPLSALIYLTLYFGRR